MENKYELWLDESGQFIEEAQLKNQNLKPSLVGGFLIEKSMVDKIPYDELIDSRRNHAMNLTDASKKNYVLPILERMKSEFGAHQVFFENAEYADAESGRQLYLRIIAEGILQLLQHLNAQSESVELSILIAQRQDVFDSANRTILSEEYCHMLSQLIDNKKKEHKMFLHKNSSLEFRVRPAHLEQKLQLADFACNTRLTRDSKAFNSVRDRVMAVEENAYIFTLSEITSANFIKKSLAEGYIADAVMELYTTKDELNHNEMLELIMERMRNTNYRLVKSQMKQCIANVIAYAAKEDDYEIGEKFLLAVSKEFIHKLKIEKQPYKELGFAILIQLADMYLREGDIIAAKKTLEKCRQVQLEMGDSLENVFTYYQLLEKEALLAIDEFDYKKGYEIMKEASSMFDALLRLLPSENGFSKRFPSLKSEYYGDALCMQIYAMMFLQRGCPDLYEEMCRLSDIALEQYPDRDGELERHRQYRSHIEMEAGNYSEALIWLFRAKCFYQEDITKEVIVEFLDVVCDSESEISCKYYLMYYLLIMCESKINKEPLADVMYEALLQQARMLEYGGLDEIEENDMQDVDLSDVQPENTSISYHPQEVIYWKYATYHNLACKWPTALKYYKKALMACYNERGYLAMNVVGLGIEAERIGCMYRSNNVYQAKDIYKKLLKRIDSMEQKNISAGTKSFIDELAKTIKPDEESLWKAARLITY